MRKTKLELASNMLCNLPNTSLTLLQIQRSKGPPTPPHLPNTLFSTFLILCFLHDFLIYVTPSPSLSSVNCLLSLAYVLSLSLCVDCRHHYQPLQSTSEEAIMLVPPWLEPLLSTAFFTICQTHVSLPRNECNMFCIDCCLRSAFCFYCRSIWHQHHRVIQIRRSSYHDVVRVSEIDKVLDISGVQTYVINSAKVFFLNERPQPKTSYGGKSSPHFCKICRRSLLDPFCFCSLGCKLVGIKKNKDSNKKVGSEERRRLLMEPSKEENDEFEEGNGNKELYESSKQNGRLPRPLKEAHSTSRRRKGIPQRAPVGP